MKRSTRTFVAAIAMVVAAAFSTGCLSGREFRDIAGPAVHSGVALILDGLVDGVFAVIDPDTAAGSG